MIRLRFTLLGILFCVVSLMLLSFFFLSVGAKQPELKSFAESKVSEYLKAKVQIGEVEAGFWNQLRLSSLQIEADPKQSLSYHIQVEEIHFRYSLLQLLMRKLHSPVGIILKSPNFKVDEASFPYSFFQDLNLGQTKNGISSLEFSGGEIRYQIPGWDAELFLKNIQGRVKPASAGRLFMQLSADLQGVVQGKIKMRGEVSPWQKQHRFDLELDEVRPTKPLSVLQEPFSGKARWENDDLFLDSIRSKIHGWKLKLQGNILAFATEPLISVDLQMGKNLQRVSLNARADFMNHRLEGLMRVPGFTQRALEGKIYKEDLKILFKDLEVEGGYLGEGTLDLDQGKSWFSFNRENQRLFWNVDLKSSQMVFNLNLDHVNVYGLDLVTRSSIRLSPVEDQTWKLQGSFETDYFVLEYTPFDDFHGTFEVSPLGVRNIRAKWGSGFHLMGRLLPKSDGPEMNLKLRVNNFDLSDIKQFAAKPLPKDLGGKLEGKVKLTGAISKPEVSGKFSIKKGKMGRLDYDLGIIQFHGYPPYLALEDSRFMKGRTTFYLKGALDLSLQNMFHGVRMETADKFVVLKGWEINTSETQGDLEIEPVFDKWPMLAFKAGARSGNSATGEETPERYVAVGPKVKF